MIIIKAIFYGLILNPYFITVFVGNLIGVLYIRRVNRKYEIRKGIKR